MCVVFSTVVLSGLKQVSTGSYLTRDTALSCCQNLRKRFTSDPVSITIKPMWISRSGLKNPLCLVMGVEVPTVVIPIGWEGGMLGPLILDSVVEAVVVTGPPGPRDRRG